MMYLTDPVKHLINKLKNKKKSIKELMVRLCSIWITHFRNNCLNPAIALLDLMEMKIPDKPNHRNQKNRLK